MSLSGGLEEQHLRDDHVRRRVLDLGAEEHDSLAEQPREDVEGALEAPVGLDDHRDEVRHGTPLLA
jgi:hypothetical protein